MTAKEFLQEKVRGLTATPSGGLMKGLGIPVIHLINEGDFLSDLMEEYANLRVEEELRDLNAENKDSWQQSNRSSSTRSTSW